MAFFGRKFIKAILTAEVESACRFEPNWVSVYEDTPIDEFNALLEGEILTLRMRYRFAPNSHGDWVCPVSWYIVASAIGNPDEQEHVRPLNSWVLKDPVGLIPALEELEQEVKWRKLLSSTFFKGELIETSAEETHSRYVREACKEMLTYERLLWDWARLGSRQDQEEWVLQKEERDGFRAKIKLQRKNVMDARKKLELFTKTGAPDFLICQAAGQSVREKKMLDKMHEALLVRN